MAQNPEMLSRGHTKLTLAAATLMLEAAERKSQEMGLAMDIAICDEGGNLLAFHRMLGAKITSIEVAIGKAFTAAETGIPTAKYGEMAGAGKTRLRHQRQQRRAVHDRWRRTPDSNR